MVHSHVSFVLRARANPNGDRVRGGVVVSGPD
jgi:hypothetical protein